MMPNISLKSTCYSTGSFAKFGEFYIDVEAGDIIVHDIGAPILDITQPLGFEHVPGTTVLVEGTATDDSGVDSITVNGVEVEFTSTNNPNDPNEVSFSTTVEGLEFGENTITVVATDTYDKTTSVERIVISDYENGPPLADAGLDQTLEQTSYAGADVTLDGSGSSDPDDDTLTYTWIWDGGSATGVSPTETFPYGTTTVTLTVDDGELTDTNTVDIEVKDTTPPEITLKDVQIILWPPNHNYHTVEITDFVASVTDICVADVDIEDIVITSVSSDEPEDIKGGGDGKTLDDIVIVDSQTVDLRAERQGSGNGRVYTINFAVSDGHGNTATGSFKVAVPHDQSGNPAVDDGTGAGYTVYP